MTAWLFALVSNHWFQASIAADIANFFIWMSILRRHDLSLAVPLSSLSYFTVIALSTILLHEAVTPLQLVGLGAVGIGIILIAGPDSGDTGDIAKDPVSDANIVRSDAANIFIQEAVKDGAP